MPNTTEFSTLENRVAALRENMLPKIFSPEGDYSEFQEDCAIGYRLLVHAEIESFIETSAMLIMNKYHNKWGEEKEASHVLLCLLACFHSGWKEHDANQMEMIIEMAKNRSKTSKESVKDLIGRAHTDYARYIKNNHGIKANNLRTLLEPIGVDFDELDEPWLIEMDSFGTMRGQFAHNSKTTSEAINPQDELGKVEKIMEGLKNLDEKFYDLLNG